MKNKIFWWVFGFIVFVIFRIISSVGLDEDTSIECFEESLKDTRTGNYLHTRNWMSNHDQHCLTYESSMLTSEASKADRERLNHPMENMKYNQHWGTIYAQLVEQNRERLEYFVDSLRNHLALGAMTPSQQLSTIVSLVQDIPYVLIKTGSCDEGTNSGSCEGGHKFGVLSGPEFIYSLKGDCDTRCLLLYAVLEALGYDAMIMISKQYRHAMLAVNTTATGDYYMYQHKKYYFWETTGKGWQIGMLPPDMQNINYWKIALS
ncbi:hypothetical protein [Reichenbachiella ulvae]|uniref:Transglutaminase-like superfamily protein n=1 Tax=Reichenbachiella ulvae TaxID=2980104 RepID=A0ABT3CWX3_9BACT|nr:hypothetical protein [Reichenbachiella ulvae]MCV9388206.1 hypothetical protein [Reichenbachiella ulvae]